MTLITEKETETKALATESITRLNLDSVLDSMRGKPVAIAGFGQSSRSLIFNEPEEVQLWGMNSGHTWLTRFDVWFDMHPVDDFNSKMVTDRVEDYMEFLESCPVPMFNQEHVDWIKNSVRYPIEKVIQGTNVRRIDEKGMVQNTDSLEYYHTSTITYMIALAIYLEVPSISLYGIDLVDRHDYIQQRAGVEFYLGLAMGKGIKIKLPEVCPLLSGPVYGKEYNHFSESATARLLSLEERQFSLVCLVNAAIGKADQYAHLRKFIDEMGNVISSEAWGEVQKELDTDVHNFVGEINKINGELTEARRHALAVSGIDSLGIYRVNFAKSDRFKFV